MAQEDENKTEDQEEGNEQVEERVEEEQHAQLPPASFENFVFNLYNTVLMYLGFQDPETGKLIRNLPLARHTIDTLGMIQEKTKGNLEAPEGNLLENMLYELRMNYIRATKAAEEEPKEEAPKEDTETESDTAESEEGSEDQKEANEQS